MVKDMRETFRKGKSMGKAPMFGKQGIPIKESSNVIKGRDWGCINGTREDITKVSGVAIG